MSISWWRFDAIQVPGPERDKVMAREREVTRRFAHMERFFHVGADEETLFVHLKTASSRVNRHMTFSTAPGIVKRAHSKARRRARFRRRERRALALGRKWLAMYQLPTAGGRRGAGAGLESDVDRRWDVIAIGYRVIDRRARKSRCGMCGETLICVPCRAPCALTDEECPF